MEQVIVYGLLLCGCWLASGALFVEEVCDD